LRDNLLETSAATVTTAGDLTYADAANSMGSRLAIGSANSIMVSTGSAPVWRTIQRAFVATSQGTTSTTYTDLTTTGPEVVATTGTDAIVIIGGGASNGTAGSGFRMSYAVSGASTVSADDARAWGAVSSAASDVMRSGMLFAVGGLTAGSNTFTAKYRAITSGTATFQDRRITVIPL
jgi:hypothetical protein